MVPVLVVILHQGCFHGEIRVILFVLVPALLVKNRLQRFKRYRSHLLSKPHDYIVYITSFPDLTCPIHLCEKPKARITKQIDH